MAVGVQQEREAVGGKAVSAAPQEAWRDPKWSQYKVRVFYHYFAFVQMLLVLHWSQWFICSGCWGVLRVFTPSRCDAAWPLLYAVVWCAC